jgi:hypothetical protein
MQEDLRRIDRIHVCCRVEVQDRYGVWTAVTEDICSRGCRILTPRMLRPGTPLTLRLSSDLFPEELEAEAQAVWSTPERLGVMFLDSAAENGNGLSPEAWVRMVVEHGSSPGSPSRVVPVVSHVAASRALPGARAARALPGGDVDNLVVLPLRKY